MKLLTSPTRFNDEHGIPSDYKHVEEPGIKVQGKWQYFGVHVRAQPVDSKGQPMQGERIDLNYFKPVQMRMVDRSRY